MTRVSNGRSRPWRYKQRRWDITMSKGRVTTLAEGAPSWRLKQNLNLLHLATSNNSYVLYSPLCNHTCARKEWGTQKHKIRFKVEESLPKLPSSIVQLRRRVLLWTAMTSHCWQSVILSHTWRKGCTIHVSRNGIETNAGLESASFKKHEIADHDGEGTTTKSTEEMQADTHSG